MSSLNCLKSSNARVISVIFDVHHSFIDLDPNESLSQEPWLQLPMYAMI